MGSVFTEGLLVLRNVGDTDVVLDSIKQEIDGDVFEPVEIVMAGADRRLGAVQLAEGFPPRRDSLGELSPVSGFTIPATGWGSRLGAEVLFGYRVTAEGESTRQSVEVTFTADGETQSMTYRAKLTVRAEPESSSGRC